MKPKALRDYEWQQSLDYMCGEAELMDQIARESQEQQNMKIDTSSIEYRASKPTAAYTDVFLGGKRVGTIRNIGPGKYQYFPRGSKTGGEVFPSLRACQKSLEEE